MHSCIIQVLSFLLNARKPTCWKSKANRTFFSVCAQKAFINASSDGYSEMNIIEENDEYQYGQNNYCIW